MAALASCRLDHTHSLTDLVDHVEEVHHTRVRMAAPLLLMLAEDVLDQSGDQAPAAGKVRQGICLMLRDLYAHMGQEEYLLFPSIRELECRSMAGDACKKCLIDPLELALAEHESIRNKLSTIMACVHELEAGMPDVGAVQTLASRIEHFAHDMETHIYEETQLLFPRAAAVQRNLRKQASR